MDHLSAPCEDKKLDRAEISLLCLSMSHHICSIPGAFSFCLISFSSSSLPSFLSGCLSAQLCLFFFPQHLQNIRRKPHETTWHNVWCEQRPHIIQPRKIFVLFQYRRATPLHCLGLSITFHSHPELSNISLSTSWRSQRKRNRVSHLSVTWYLHWLLGFARLSKCCLLMEYDGKGCHFCRNRPKVKLIHCCLRTNTQVSPSTG